MPIEESHNLGIRQRTLVVLQNSAAYLLAPRKAITVVLGASILARRFLVQTVNDAATEGERQLDEISGSLTQAVATFWGADVPAEHSH